MKTIDIVRLGLAGAILYFALYGAPKDIPVLPDPYDGPYTSLNQLAEKMDSVDRKGLSEALLASSVMMDSDKAGLIKTTEDAQQLIRGTIGFGYTSFSVKKYPEVANSVQKEFMQALGEDVVEFTPELRQKMVNLMQQLSQAIE